MSAKPVETLSPVEFVDLISLLLSLKEVPGRGAVPVLEINPFPQSPRPSLRESRDTQETGMPRARPLGA